MKKYFAMRFYLAGLIFLLLSFGLSAQRIPSVKKVPKAPTTYVPPVDISGKWSGELYQGAGGIAERFELNMEIHQIGPAIKGVSFVRLGNIWAEMEFSGSIQNNGSWKISEFRVLRAEKPEELSWCMKQFRLVVGYSAEGLTLSGPWWGNSSFGPCVPGSVRLRRKIKRV